MQTVQPSTFARPDTLLGVCQAIGEDLGFNPLWLRMTFGVLLLWNPVPVIGAYAAAAVVVGFTRWLYPNPHQAEAPEAAEPAAARAEAEALPLAA